MNRQPNSLENKKALGEGKLLQEKKNLRREQRIVCTWFKIYI